VNGGKNMAMLTLKTQFAPAERADIDSIQNNNTFFSRQLVLLQTLNSTPVPILVLNKERQTVFFNKGLTNFLQIKEIDHLIGDRPGEILKCIHAVETTGGCGTTEFCSACGAVQAILNSQKGRDDEKECRITTTSGTALDLRVWANPLYIEDQFYTVFTIADISSEKRKRALERIFFHDVLNTAGGIYGFSEILKDATPEEIEEFSGIIHSLSTRLIEEINAQKELTAAESGELIAQPEEVFPYEIIKQTIESYSKHDVAKNKSIKTTTGNQFKIKTDKVLLRRVIGNLLKNALEATPPDGEVTISCKTDDKSVSFFVSNPSFIPRSIQLQIFQRSFSTKGNGRGLGTYSIKLLTDKYLKGKVSFISNENDGTTFKVDLPLELIN